jgi:hypothetical protein
MKQVSDSNHLATFAALRLTFLDNCPLPIAFLLLFAALCRFA